MWISGEDAFYLTLAFVLNYRNLPDYITQDFKKSAFISFLICILRLLHGPLKANQLKKKKKKEFSSTPVSQKQQ